VRLRDHTPNALDTNYEISTEKRDKT